MSISIVIPIFNVEEYVAECIQSVLDQKSVDFEIVVINDGSDDNSPAIVKRIAERDPRVKIYSYKNGGLSVARNVGLLHCTKEYIIFLDGDDRLMLGELSNIYHIAKANDLDCLLFSSSIFYDFDYSGPPIEMDYQRPNSLVNKIMTGPEMFSQLMTLKKYNVSACMYIFRFNLLQDHKFLKDIYYEDNLFTTKLLLLGKNKKYSCTDIKLYQRRVRHSSITTIPKNKKHIQGFLTVYEAIKIEITKADNEWVIKNLKDFSLNLLNSANLILSSKDVKYSKWAKAYRILIVKNALKDYGWFYAPKRIVTLIFPGLIFVKHKAISILNRLRVT